MGSHALGLVMVLAAASACGGQSSSLEPGEMSTMIDSLMPLITAASGLEERTPVRFAIQPRAEVRRYIEAQLAEELGPEELAGMERAYRMFGLLPDTLDLRALLLDLYTEQVVGYYDPRTDRLYVVEGVTRAEAAPVVAHELVHALQDQYTDLDSLVARERGNDRQIAAQAAAEGQATLVMIALQAAEAYGQAVDPAALPDLGELLRPALESQNAEFPVFQRAPRLIRETLLFPYLGGANFVQALYRARAGEGPPVPFGPLLPQSTEQVLAPAERFLGDRDAPTEIRIGESETPWRVSYTNTLGQLETRILLEEHLGAAAGSAAQGWDGDRFALLSGPAGSESLVWYSVWDDAAAADRFAAAYRRVLAARPGPAGEVSRLEVDGRPVVRVVQASGRDALDRTPVPPIASLEERDVL